jgi:F-type H+-transporting ATPase subunit epsilon
MADKTQFELVSPERLLVSEAVAMVVVPGTEGNFGVLPGHSLFISTVRPGVIDVYEDDRATITDRIFVSGGFAEVTPERCTVLADEALPIAQIDVATVEADLRTLEGVVTNLREQLARAAGADREQAALELKAAERDVAAAQAKLAAVRGGAPAGAAAAH